MRTEFDHNAAQSTHREKCSICGREWYDSLVGVCPERGRKVCMYCCQRLCQHSYKGFMGWGCRVKDKERAKKGKKQNEISSISGEQNRNGTGERI